MRYEQLDCHYYLPYRIEAATSASSRKVLMSSIHQFNDKLLPARAS